MVFVILTKRTFQKEIDLHSVISTAQHRGITKGIERIPAAISMQSARLIRVLSPDVCWRHI